jgi:hypothetical protein
MEGGTTFHFVTDGIHAALERARGRGRRPGRAHRRRRRHRRPYLRAGLVDEIHLALAPALLGSGEALLAGIDLRGARLRAHRACRHRQRDARRPCPAKPVMSESPRSIAFDRHKYGMPLLVDACSVASIPASSPSRCRTVSASLRDRARHRRARPARARRRRGRGRARYPVLVTRPGETRRWQLERARLQGWLAFFEAEFLDDFFADPCFVGRIPALTGPAAGRAIALPPRRFDALVEHAETMAAELVAPRSDSSHLLRADMVRLLTLLQRASPAPAAPAPPDPSLLARSFAGRLAAEARMGESVARHAERLGTSARALNRSLRVTFGRTRAS